MKKTLGIWESLHNAERTRMFKALGFIGPTLTLQIG